MATADTLSIPHDIKNPRVWQTLLLHRPVLPHFANITIPLDALQRAENTLPMRFAGYRICADDVRSVRRIQVEVQTVILFVPNGWSRLREKFTQDEETLARSQETGFEDSVTVNDPEEMGDWSGFRGDQCKAFRPGASGSG
ncbi:hypothetical protein CkaCkLH20_11452 [Colletotrichum karsti]|uniref:Uncharacterized protein n=1 Tax=Colletotrichum karsti TaxID=1095194 RepID=A0A9P6LFX3_9PEZI|nr:uncharacterized protein CkaCkLH20_11452 [Colletotrichum karsti]KAF9871035.1 hypothetical protein CkaCkLH20_11452 [Colletotrichum karsti]